MPAPRAEPEDEAEKDNADAQHLQGRRGAHQGHRDPAARGAQRSSTRTAIERDRVRVRGGTQRPRPTATRPMLSPDLREGLPDEPIPEHARIAVTRPTSRSSSGTTG